MSTRLRASSRRYGSEWRIVSLLSSKHQMNILMFSCRAKYPLAIVDALLDAFGLKIGGGYDIGCDFETTIKNSDLGDKARNNHFRSLVGSFHGHAHNRLCQLSFLATYVKGMELEDLEGCEQFFS